MECNKQKIIEYVLDEISQDERNGIESHISSCESCNKDFKEIKMLLEEFHIKEPDVSSKEWEGIELKIFRKTILDLKQDNKRVFRFNPFNIFSLRPVVYTFVLMLVFLLGFLSGIKKGVNVEDAKKNYQEDKDILASDSLEREATFFEIFAGALENEAIKISGNTEIINCLDEQEIKVFEEQLVDLF